MNDPRLRLLPLLGILTGLLLLLALPPVVAAQDQPESPAPEAAAGEASPPELAAVPAPEIAREATEVNRHLRDLARQAAPDAVQIGIQKDLPDLLKQIQTFADAGVNRDLEAAQGKLLNDADQQWNRFDTALTTWSVDLDERAQTVQGVLADLANLQEVWRLTAEAAARDSLPQAVQDQVGLVRSSIERVGGEVGDQQAILLTLQNQISEQRIAIAGVMEKLSIELEARSVDLYRAIVTPIWKPVGAEDGSLSLGRDAAATWSRVEQGATEFWDEYQAELFWHLVSVALLAAVMWLLRQRVAVGEDPEAGLDVAQAILRRPVAAAGLLSLVTSSWLLYDGAPLVIHSIIPLTAVPFAAMLTPAIVPPERRRLIYWILLLTFLVNVQTVIVAVGLLRQLALAVIPVLGLVGLEVFRRRVRREDPVIWPRISQVALILGTVAFVATLVTAILGYVPLGEMFINATVESAYIAFLLLAVNRIIDGVVVLSLQSQALRQLRVVQNHAPAIRRKIIGFVRIASSIVWLAALTDRLSLQDKIFGGIRSWLTAEWGVGSLTLSMGAIILFLVVLWLVLLVAKIVRHLLEDDILPRAEMPRGRAHAVSMLVNYIIVSLGFLMALGAAGIRMEQFALIGGALGVGIGFGLQNVVNNFVSGLILVFERPVQVGDTVEVGTLIGTVRRIGIRSSTVRTFDEAEVIVPNSDLITSHVVNWTLSDQLRRMEVKVGVQYGTEPVRVQEILVAEAKAHTKVLEYPSPYALFKGFGDSSLDFVVRFWTSDYGNWIFIASEVTVGIEKALGDAGITIPFPQRDLHIYSVDPPAPIPDGGRPVLPPAPEPEREPERGNGPDVNAGARPPQIDGDE